MLSSVTLIVVLFSAGALPEAALPYKIPGTNSLFLGNVDGKSYLAEDSTPLKWSAAKAHCASLGMRLASVETAAEKNFLAGIDHNQFQAYYWTAGRDARNPHQFVWDHNAKLVSENFDSLAWYYPERSCILFNSRTGDKTYQSAACEGSASSKGPFGALCESI